MFFGYSKLRKIILQSIDNDFFCKSLELWYLDKYRMIRFCVL